MTRSPHSHDPMGACKGLSAYAMADDLPGGDYAFLCLAP